jgi:hypothetical protein
LIGSGPSPTEAVGPLLRGSECIPAQDPPTHRRCSHVRFSRAPEASPAPGPADRL